MPDQDRLAVVTIAAGRHDHLTAMLQGLLRGTRQPDLVVVVAMGDPAIGDVTATALGTGPSGGLAGRPRHRVAELPVGPDGLLPLAAARNLGADLALADGCTGLVFLDVDCIPGERLVERYATCLAGARGAAGTDLGGPGVDVWCGPVHYLPPADPPGSGYRFEDLDGLAPAHPARPAPADGTVLRADDLRLFWSLSFAMTAPGWLRAGGFDADYRGYGGEDTDFAMRLAAVGARMWWLGGAQAYHQHHRVSSPPVEHLDAIVRNANRFASRWGWFPMEGWLAAFHRAGLADYDPSTDRWVVTGARPGPADAAEA